MKKTLEAKLTITCTKFLEFICEADWSKKFAVVEKALDQPSTYDPRTDFYKQLREVFTRMHTGQVSPGNLDDAIKNVSNPIKRANYTPVIAGFRQAWARNFGGQDVKILPQRTLRWEYAGLKVSVSAQLGFVSEWHNCLVRLWCNKNALGADQSDLIANMMQRAFLQSDHGANESFDFGVMDVRRANLSVATSFDSLAELRLQSAAVEFMHIAKALHERADELQESGAFDVIE